MTAEDNEELFEMELDRTVLHELLSKSRPIETHFHVRYEHGNPGLREGWVFVGISDTDGWIDEEWQRIRASPPMETPFLERHGRVFYQGGENRADSVKRNVEPTLFYDEERGTVYHVDSYSSGELFKKQKLGMRNGETGDAHGLKSADAEIQETANRVLKRLFPARKQFGPSGYSEWMTRNLERRFSTAKGRMSDIPHYGNLCKQCLRMLTHSLVLYEEVLAREICPKPVLAMTGRRHDYRRIDLDNEIFGHHGTIQALFASAGPGGCHLCSLLIAPLRSEDFSSLKTSKVSYHLRIDKYSKIRIQAHGTAWQALWITPLGHYREGSSTLKYPHTDTPEISRQTKQWLEYCLKNHAERCVNPVGFLPTRLIKVASSPQGSLSASLVLHKELPKVTQYITLSHSWGKVIMLTLTTENFEQFRDTMPVHSLTKTFQEALRTTRDLGYEYIWIDSLCILQDSKDDWEKESAAMGLVYRHSTCTIAATGAEDGTQGLFFQRNALSFTDCPLFTSSDGQDRRKTLFAHHIIEWPEPLANRAWTVQEQVLSTRYIKYGSDRVSWSCRQSTLVEGPHTRESSRAYSLLAKSATLLNKGEGSDRDTYDYCWTKLVEFYSGRTLTYWTDKWPAFRGVATEIAKARGRTLIHGLWLDRICEDLLWKTQEPQKGTLDCGEPSWTWLNSKGCVSLPETWVKHDMKKTAARVAPWPMSDEIHITQSPKAQTPPHQSKDQTEKQPGLEKPLDGEASQPLDFQPEDSGNVLRITAVLAHCKFEGEKSYRILDKPVRTSYHLRLITRQYQHPNQEQHFEGQWWPDGLPVQQPTHARLLHLNDTVRRMETKCIYTTSGLVIMAVKGRPGDWRRLGMYEVTVDLDADSSIRSWPWAEDKRTIHLI